MFGGNRNDRQEVLDYLYQQFYVNKVPVCGDVEGNCKYAPQTSEQIGCAVGCLLTAKEQEEVDYKLAGGNSGVGELMREFPLLFDEELVHFLEDCQKAHDSEVLLHHSIYENIAIDHNLTDPHTGVSYAS